MHLFLKKIYRKNPFPKIYRINQCEVLNSCYRKICLGNNENKSTKERSDCRSLSYLF